MPLTTSLRIHTRRLNAGCRPARRPRPYRPWLEALEARLAPTVTLSISDPVPFPKPDSGRLMGMFIVTRTGDLAAPVLVDYATEDGAGVNAAHAGIDYVATAGTLLFDPNQITATIIVPVIGNNIFQADKVFAVILSSPSPGVVFAPTESFANGVGPYSVAMGDFNGDGKPDLAIANKFSNTISVLLNTTPVGATIPSFTTQRTFITSPSPRSVTVGDFNGDGKPDLAVVTSSSAVSVLLNTTPIGATTPSFALARTFATGSGSYSVAVGDFNGDGKPDLAVANYRSSTVSVLLNTTPAGATTPSFAPQQTFATGFLPKAMTVADFNGDGKPDLAVANYRSNNVSVLLNTTPSGATTPTFAPQQAFATGSSPRSVAVGDFNGDGRLDLAVANQGSNSVSVLLNTTPVGQTTPAFAPQQTFTTGRYPVSVAAADINGDGKSDIAITSGFGGLSVLLNRTPADVTTLSFAPQQTFPVSGRSLAVGDFNGDGKLDLAIANQDANNVFILLNVPAPITVAPSLYPQQAFTTDSFPASVAIGDFNGDGKPDLATPNGVSHTVSVLLNTTPTGATTPSFSPQATFSIGRLAAAVAVGDFNGDGKPDLAVSTLAYGTVSILLNSTPAGATVPSFAPGGTFAAGDEPGFLAVGDFNGDGKPDLAVADQFSNRVSVVLNTTPAGATVASFAPYQTFAADSAPVPISVAVGDFNGDGKPDLAIANFGADAVSVLLNTTPAGATIPSFAPYRSFATDLDPVSVAVGDFNGDGKLDIAVAIRGTDTVSVLLNTTPPGATSPTFAPQEAFAAGGSPDSVAVADFTGDGLLDIAVANYRSSTVSVLLNTTPAGATIPRFATQLAFATGNNPRSVAVGDFNGDGQPDLAVADTASNTVSVLLDRSVPILLDGSPAVGIISSAAQAPAAVMVVSGTTPQSAIVNTPFTRALAVDVRNAAGTFIQGVSVTFTSPGSGPNGSFGGMGSVTVLTDASGRATAPAFVANTLAGSYMVTAQAAGGRNPTDSFSLTNTPAAASDFTLTNLPASVVAGTPNNLTVTARDPFNNIATGYTGTVHFSSTDPNTALPDDYTFTAADHGVHTFAGLVLQTAGTHFVIVYDTADGRIDGVSSSVRVVAAAADHFAITTSAADPEVAGTPFDVTVTAQDAYGNTVTDYTGNVTFSSGDPYGASLPDDYTFQPGDQGMAAFPGGATLYTAGSWDVTATDTSSGITGLAFVSVQAAPAVAFQVIAPASAVSGTPFDVTLIAVDAYGNTDTNYQGTVTWTTADPDPGVQLPADYTFQPSDAGMVTFPGGVVLITPGDQTITATDTADGTITGSATVSVSNTGPSAGTQHGRTAATLKRMARDDVFASFARERWDARAWALLVEPAPLAHHKRDGHAADAALGDA